MAQSFSTAEFAVDYEIRDTAKARELTLHGRLTFEGNEHFRKIIDALSGQAQRPMCVDVSKLEFIDSAGLGMLLLLNEAAGGRVTLQGPQGQVKRLLAASQFNTLVPIVG